MTVDVEYLVYARSGARADEEHATGAIGFDGVAVLLEAQGAGRAGWDRPGREALRQSPGSRARWQTGSARPAPEGHDPGSPPGGPGRLPGERPGWAGPVVDGAAALRIQRLIDTI